MFFGRGRRRTAAAKVVIVVVKKVGGVGNACRFFRLSLPGLKVENKNQLSPFPLLHQPAKEFRGCSLENQISH